MIVSRCVAGRILSLGCLVLGARAYIPALPTNQSDAIQAGLNESDTSMLQLQWYPNASYSETVSYQLVGAESTGINRGALVHFSELDLTSDTTTTPWIALVSCDFNTTDFSLEDDIFTLARDRGAVAALLYSQWSQACIINAAYADPATFDQVFDIFSTKMLTSARTVLNAFTNVNQTLYGDFNAVMLNQTAQTINESIATSEVPRASYLFASLIASNATLPGNDGSSGGGPASTSSTDSNNTDLAMIVLYVITGAVSFLFCIVILSGAIRAIRHPERYGPRPADPTMGEFGMGQSRARGLTRAILDTFPVVKFSRPAEGAPGSTLDVWQKTVDVESTGANATERPMEMHANELRGQGGKTAADVNEHPQSPITEVPRASISDENGVLRDTILAEEHLRASSAVAGPSSHGDSTYPPARPRERENASMEPRDSMHEHNVVPEAIGRDTCPICIVDFEEGDDIRVLPCEGHHIFHQTCVDPWLLELSSSCPICRQDFHALEEMIAGGSTDHGMHGLMPSENRISTVSTPGSRFSRYLRFARGRRGRHSHRPWGNRDSVTDDPTDPPLRTVYDTRL